MGDFRKALADDALLLFDGAMGTLLQGRGLAPGESPELFGLKSPEAIVATHREYVQAGSRVITSNTFGGSRYKLPQMGWNRVHQQLHEGRAHPVWQGIPDGAYFYFLHSYHVQPSDARNTAGRTDYGASFTSAIARDNIFATQFHPEKSADLGLALYRNFLLWKP